MLATITYLPTKKSLKGKVGMEGGKGGCSNKPYLRDKHNLMSICFPFLGRNIEAGIYSFRWPVVGLVREASKPLPSLDLYHSWSNTVPLTVPIIDISEKYTTSNMASGKTLSKLHQFTEPHKNYPTLNLHLKAHVFNASLTWQCNIGRKT